MRLMDCFSVNRTDAPVNLNRTAFNGCLLYSLYSGTFGPKHVEDCVARLLQREREIEEGEERDMSPIHVIPTFMFQNNERCHNLQVHRVDVQAPWGVLQLAHQTLLELELYGHRTTQGPRRYGRQIMCWIVLKIHENTFAQYSDLTRTSWCDKSPKTSLLKPTTKKTSKILITGPSTSWGEFNGHKGPVIRKTFPWRDAMVFYHCSTLRLCI